MSNQSTYLGQVARNVGADLAILVRFKVCKEVVIIGLAHLLYGDDESQHTHTHSSGTTATPSPQKTRLELGSQKENNTVEFW